MSIQKLPPSKNPLKYAFNYYELSNSRGFDTRSIPQAIFCAFKCKKVGFSKNVISCTKYKSNFLAAIGIFILPCQSRIYFIPIIPLYFPNFEGYRGILYSNVSCRLIWWEMFTLVTKFYWVVFTKLVSFLLSQNLSRINVACIT